MLVVVSKIINKVKVCGMFLFQIGVLYPVSRFLFPLYKEHLCSPNTQMSALYVVSIFVGEHQSYNARNRLSRIKTIK